MCSDVSNSEPLLYSQRSSEEWDIYLERDKSEFVERVKELADPIIEEHFESELSRISKHPLGKGWDFLDDEDRFELWKDERLMGFDFEENGTDFIHPDIVEFVKDRKTPAKRFAKYLAWKGEAGVELSTLELKFLYSFVLNPNQKLPIEKGLSRKDKTIWYRNYYAPLYFKALVEEAKFPKEEAYNALYVFWSATAAHINERELRNVVKDWKEAKESGKSLWNMAIFGENLQ